MKFNNFVLIILVISLSVGCATVPYQITQDIEGPNTLKLRTNESQVERGKPIPIVDGLGHYLLSLPSKIILWNWRVDNHNISIDTEEKLVGYLSKNNLNNVKVRVNQYAPGREWRRLFHNEAVGEVWRYTLGILSVSFYTILPGRAFGGDNFNPYTNTINLYSDHKGIAIHEGGHAKDAALRKYKGTYAALRLLPLFPLYQEAVATADALGYDKELGQVEDEKADYKILYPAFGTYIGGEGLRWVNVPAWISYAISFSSALPGHIVGRVKAARVEESL